MPTLLLAEINSLHLIPITAIAGGLALTAIIIVFGLKYLQRRQELWHETARIALEKGQPLPPLPADMRQEKHPDHNSDFRTGLIMVATGAGLYLFFVTFLPSLRFLATIPGFIGAALLLYAGLNALFVRKDRPPQS